MTRLFGRLKSLRPWQWLVLLVVFAGGAGGTYGIYTFVTGSDDVSLAEDQQLVPVVRSDLVTSISVNGSLTFPNTEPLSFDSQGTLGELAVEEGQTVTAGQTLAELDTASVAALERDMAQARVDLQTAEEALADLQAPPTPLEIAEAGLKVAKAKETLQESRDNLVALFDSPTEHAIAEAESAVAKARLAADTAQETLDSLKGPPDQDEIDALQFQVRQGEAALENAHRDLTLALKEWNDKVAAAEDAIEPLLEDYTQLFNKWLGVDPGLVDAEMDPDALLARWGVSLETLFDPSARFIDMVRGSLSQSPPPDDPNTPWNEVVIYAWTNLSPYDIQPVCEAAPAADTVLCIEAELSDGWEKLESSRANLDTVNTQAEKEISIAESSVDKAEDALRGAQDKIEVLQESPEPLVVESRTKELELARADLDKAESELNEMEERAALTRAVEESGADMTTGEGIDPAKLPAGSISESTRVEILASLKELEADAARLEDAEQSMAALTGRPDALLVALREAQAAAAKVDLETAMARLDGVVLVSPITGFISEIEAESGQAVDPNAKIMTVIDQSVVEVMGAVDEIDVTSVKVGAAAAVTMDALPGRTLPGTVSYIAPTADNQQGLVTYPVRIRVETPQGATLRAGLTAVARLVLRSEPNVLLIPLQAVRGSIDQPTVLVSKDGALVEKRISTGSSDDFWVVVTEGMEEGDLAVMEISGTSGFGFFGPRGFGYAGFQALRP